MALGILFLMFAVMVVLTVVGGVLLFVTKKEKTNDVILILMTVFSFFIAYISATSQPANFVTQQIVAWVIGFVALGGTVYRFLSKKQSTLSKALVTLSVVAGIAYLFIL